MSKETKNKMVPKLRFPEFQDDGNWIKETINNIFHLQDGYAFSSSDFTDSQEGSKQIVRITDINNGNRNGEKAYVLNNKIQDLKIEKYRVQKGDLLLSLTGAAGFKFFIWNSEDAYINQRTIKIFPRDKKNASLIVLLDPLISSKINGIGTGQNNNLSKDALKEIEFILPLPDEQQKIASCLSSLDELITAENQKLEALKAHKKGLMQQLFPAEGKKVPELRFEEFKESGEWEGKKLGALGEFTGGGTPSKTNLNYWEGNIPWVSSSDIDEDSIHQIAISRFITDEALKESAAKMVPANSILIVSRVGVGKLAISNEVICTSQDFTSFTPEKGNLYFFAYLLKSQKEKLLGFSQGMAIKGFTKDDISNLEVVIPSQIEQQKIADCLSSLDDLITGQSEKIETLKEHKKGLMQGLFPSEL